MAQRLERTPDKGEMGGSIPLSPTKKVFKKQTKIPLTWLLLKIFIVRCPNYRK